MKNPISRNTLNTVASSDGSSAGRRRSTNGVGGGIITGTCTF
jgi:hypothetical protein